MINLFASHTPFVDVRQLAQYLYAHATLQRVCHPDADNRQDLLTEIFGAGSWQRYPRVFVPGQDPTDYYLDDYLIKVPAGQILVLGGSKLSAWPSHVINSYFPPIPPDWIAGFYGNLAQQLIAQLQAFIPNDVTPLVITGHSLGGAVAASVAYFLLPSMPAKKVLVASYGAPKPGTKVSWNRNPFEYWRVSNPEDPVPSIGFSVLPTGPAGFLFKLELVSFQHTGFGIQVDTDGEMSFVETRSWPEAIVPMLKIGVNTLENGTPFLGHYMSTYAFCLRAVLEKMGIQPDSIWDKCNDFCNRAEGLAWKISGFPVVAGPALPGGYVPPPTLQQGELLEAIAVGMAPQTASLLTPPAGLKVLANQSLAAFLSAITGNNLTQVTVRLARGVNAHVGPQVLSDFTECDFEGYQPVSGNIWVTTLVVPAGGSQRFQAQVGFHCKKGSPPQGVAAYYITATEQGNPFDLLVGYDYLSFGFTGKKNENYGLLIECSGAPS